MIKLCVAGATGRMGAAIIKEAVIRKFRIVGTIAASEDPNQGKTLNELGLCKSKVKIMEPINIETAVKNADVYISFTSPEGELNNIPIVARLGKKMVIGTTGFTKDQKDTLEKLINSKVPAVISPNFAIGINFMLKILRILKEIPKDYDIAIMETHHSSKKDAPSGTAKTLAKVIAEIKGYNNWIHGRKGIDPRTSEDLEILSSRIGGVPGIHKVSVAGPYEMLTIEHVAFSRRVFAQGALYAAEWLIKQNTPKIYSLENLFSHE